MYPGYSAFLLTYLTDRLERLHCASHSCFRNELSRPHATWILGHTLEEERRDEEFDGNLPAGCGNGLPVPVGSSIILRPGTMPAARKHVG